MPNPPALPLGPDGKPVGPGTPAKIYYKNEAVSPAGSHKPDTAVAQAYYTTAAGINRPTTETGAGQWSCLLALAGQLFGLDVRMYMVKISYQQNPGRFSRITFHSIRAAVI